jgi:pimeloyl-ACP methyl ester carboxylesterase
VTVHFYKLPEADLFEKIKEEKKEYKGTEFEFLKAGEGKQTIILLPGAFMKPYMWFYVMSKLSEKYQVISPNIPKTCVGGKEKIDHIKELIDSLSLKKVIMLGYSYGGGLAQYFVEKYPEYVEILVLSHTGVFRREDPVEQTESLLRKIRYLPPISLKILQRIRVGYGKESKWYKFRNAFFKLAFKEITKNRFIEYLEDNLVFFKDVEHLPIGKVSWNGETIILGTNTDKDTFKHFTTMKQLYPNSKDYIMENPGGHHTIFLYPEEYTNVLLKMLEE